MSWWKTLREPKRNAGDYKKEKTPLWQKLNAFDGCVSRQDLAEERRAELEDSSIENPKQKEKEKRALKKIEQNIQELWDNYKRCSIHVMGTVDAEREKFLKLW